MKSKAILTVLILILAASPAFAQFRLDAGVAIPLGVGEFTGTTLVDGGFIDGLASGNIFPIPEVGLSFQIPLLGFLRVGGGIRAFSIIIETVAFPNLYAEANLGPIVIQAQLGGLAFGYFGTLGTGIDTGINVLIPDLSVWLALGEKRQIRLGVGAIGFTNKSQVTTGFPFVYYAGAKLVLN